MARVLKSTEPCEVSVPGIRYCKCRSLCCLVARSKCWAVEDQCQVSLSCRDCRDVPRSTSSGSSAHSSAACQNHIKVSSHTPTCINIQNGDLQSPVRPVQMKVCVFLCVHGKLQPEKFCLVFSNIFVTLYFWYDNKYLQPKKVLIKTQKFKSFSFREKKTNSRFTLHYLHTVYFYIRLDMKRNNTFF